MSGVISRDHALPNGGSNAANPNNADPGGMTNQEKQAVGSVLQQDINKGATVHAFDPDATPEQKASLAGAARAQLDALPLARRKKAQDAGTALGIDTSSEGAPKPTVTVQDGDLISRGEGQEPGADGIPGNMPAGAAPSVPTWLQVGWRQVAGLDVASAMDAKKQADASLLASYMSEQMYGAWYHNAGVILFAVLATRFITSIHLGFAWVIIILAFCAAYYTLSITRTRSRARDDIQRELVKTRLVTETESADWLNQFLDRFWLIYEPVLSQTIVASVDAALAASTPGFVESIRMTTFTLGTKAPRIDYVRTFPKTPEDIVTMDWAVSFTPNDLQDITPREAQKRVNPKIVLTVRLGKGFVSKGLPILLEDMSFTGRMRIKLKLMTNYPHIKTVEMSFIEKPTFDYVLKPIGGDFGFDINNIPALAPFIRDQVHSNLGPMMYDPNVFTIDLEALLSGTPLDSAIGVLKVTILGARSIKAVKLGGGAPDPYVTLNLGAKPVIAKTKTIPSTNHPSWHETHFILVNSLADVLNLGMWDYNDRRPDNKLGVVSKELASLQEEAEQDGVVGKIIYEGKERGELRYDLSFYPVLQPVKAADGTLEPVPDTTTGIVRLTIHQAKDLDVSREHGHLNPFAQVFLGSSKTPVHTTSILKRTSQPIWESNCEFIVPDRTSSVVSINILDSKGLQRDPTIGALSIKLTDLLELKERGQDWLPLQQSRGGKLRMTAVWKPVAMAGSLSGAHDYVPPIGILRIWIKRAIDVKNVEMALGGKSDPYVRVMGRNKILARTEVVSNNLNPEWDQIVYVPIHNLKQHLVMELMDYQNIGKDRTLGYVELRAEDFIEENTGEDGEIYPFVSKGHMERNDRIKLDKANSYKGNLLWEVDFKPAASLKGGVNFEEERNDIAIAAAEEQENEGEGQGVGDGLGRVVNPGHAPRLSIGGQSVRTVNSTQTAQTTQSVGTVGTANTANMTAANNAINGNGPKAVLAGESKAGGEATDAENPEKGVVFTKEQLMGSPSGILVFQLISGTLARRGSVEVMFDDGYWPAFTSTRSRSSVQKWDQIGEGFVRELDFSRIWLRVNANDDSDKDDVVAEFKCDTKDFLDACLNEPAEFLLSLDGGNKTKLKFAARYIPVQIKLEPRESINNMGLLRVDVIRASSLHAADRSGKSDPNITMSLNGMKVFKSETIKKTLNPEWDESFECMVPSRVGSKFEFEINDWDRVGSATHLGRGSLDLAALDTFELREMTLPIIHDKLGEKGTLTIRILFQPEIIARTRGKTSTFSAAGRVVTTVGGVPLAAGKLAGKGVLLGGGAVAMGVGKGVGTVGKGVGAVGGFAGRKIGLIKKKDKSGKEVLVAADSLEAEDGYEIGDARPSVDGEGEGGRAVEETGPPPTEPGVLSVTVLGAKDIKTENGGKLKSHVAVKIAGKAHKTDTAKGVEPDWNETFTFNIAPASRFLHVALHEHQLLGKDPVLGETEVDIWQHIDSLRTTNTIPVEFPNELGTVRLRLDWSVGMPPVSTGKVSRKRSMSSLAPPSENGGHGSPSKFSGLRMSLSGRRGEEKDKD